jgi:hypothetical protein
VGRPWLSQTSCGLDRADLLWFGQRRAGVVLPKVGATRQRLKLRIGLYSDWLAGPSLVREPSQSGRPWSLLLAVCAAGAALHQSCSFYRERHRSREVALAEGFTRHCGGDAGYAPGTASDGDNCYDHDAWLLVARSL